MARLSIVLPPFSPDYSGVASALFDLNCLSVLHDASGCTGNYTGYDEPRWYGSRVPIYCSGLREIDAIMGDDEKLIDKILVAQKSLRPDMVAIIGSPVPMIVGCDVAGIAKEIENLTGVPAFGFDTTGTAYYDVGLSMACDALVSRFTQDAPKTKEPSVNILGADAIDFGGLEPLRSLSAFLASRGFVIRTQMPAGLSLSSLRAIPSAWLNLVVSRSGLSTARLLQKLYGMPYVVGLPYGENGGAHYVETVENSLVDNVPRVVHAEPAACEECSVRNVLVIGEQVSCNAVRNALVLDRGMRNVAVGGLFGMEQELGLSQDISLPDEQAIVAEMNNGRYGCIIADPLLEPLLRLTGVRFLPYPQYPVSSKLMVHRVPDLVGNGFNHHIQPFFQVGE